MDVDVIGQMLEDKGLTHEEIDAYFEHAGVKGMKWGVRRQRRLASTDRVAAGRGSALDNARQLAKTVAYNPLGVPILVKNGLSVKKVSQKRSARLHARKERMEAGKATTFDVLAHIGTMRIQDLDELMK